MDEFQPKEIDVTSSIPPFKEPRLAPDERLYVDSYFLTYSHSKSHQAVNPNLKKYTNTNKYSNRESIQYHINKRAIKRAQSMQLDGDTVMDLLLQEATRLGSGSSPTARVQALTLLGKQLGLFEDKKDDKADVVFNIVSYSSDKPVEVIEEVKEVKKIDEIPNNIVIETYGE